MRIAYNWRIKTQLFFISLPRKRKQKNTIRGLHDANGRETSDAEAVGLITKSYFQKLFRQMVIKRMNASC